ncbi:MAG: DUF5684 domain-containing protein [Deltaproteobacteria bacterium]|nr:DUF5684 domain-containing protein [Deltaproteobacteria bacterium]
MNEGFSIVQLIIFAGIYAYFAYCLMVIANKTGTENAWLAWIPIANIYLMCKVAGKPAWWLILFIIPLVNIIFAILVWSGIATARGKAGWLGVLVIIPIANLILPGYLAFTD